MSTEDKSERLNTDSISEDIEQYVRIRSGDNSAFEQLFRAYAPGLASFADGYVKSVEIAEEIVQDVFLWIWANREKWTVAGDVRTYLYGATRNAALSYLRRKKLELNTGTGLAREAMNEWQEGESIDNVIIRNEVIRTIDYAISQLSEIKRTIVTLRWIHKMSYAEIAEVIQITPKAVESQLYRALNEMKVGLKGRL